MTELLLFYYCYLFTIEKKLQSSVADWDKTKVKETFLRECFSDLC